MTSEASQDSRLNEKAALAQFRIPTRSESVQDALGNRRSVVVSRRKAEVAL